MTHLIILMKNNIKKNNEYVKNLIKKNKLDEAKLLSLKIYNSSDKNFEIINLLGIIELSLKNFEASLGYFEEVVKLEKNDPKIYNNLGILNSKIGKIEEAINYFNKAIEIDKNFINSYHNLAAIKLSKKEYKEAKHNFKKVLEFNKKNLEVLLSLSNILLIEKNYFEAKNILLEIIKLKPDHFEAFNNLGNCQIELNEIKDALKSLNQSNKIKQNKAAYNNIGLIYQKEKKFDLSVENFKKALSIDAVYLEALYNLALVYRQTKKFEKSLECYDKIFKINQNYQNIFGIKFHFEKLMCKWENYFLKTEELKNKILLNENCTPPWEILSIFDSEEIQQIATQNWLKNKFVNYKESKTFNVKKKNKKIKIGYFSPDFFKTAVAVQIAEMIEIHDREKFEIIGFSLINKIDNMQKRLNNAFDEFINIQGKTTKEILELCNKINLDIAIDLSGFTSNNKFEIFQKRCAPIQISYLGYSGTTGSKKIDYIVADTTVIPKNSQKYFSEKIIYLPDTFMVNDNKKKISNLTIDKKKYNIPQDSFILGCFNQHFKISPTIFDIWIRILLKNKSCLLLLADGNDHSKQNLIKYFIKNNIDNNRLIFAEKLTSSEEHLNRLKIVDLFLDTFPYGSHTTACDILYVEKPLIALKGNSFVSRVSSSILKSVQLEELISESLEDYENKINYFINNKDKLKELSSKIIENKKKSSLFNTKTITKNLEKAYIKVYDNFIDKKETENIYVDL